MKVSHLIWPLFATIITPTYGASLHDVGESNEAGQAQQLENWDIKNTEDSLDDSTSTTFNEVRVPPMKTITATEFDETVKEGYWFVKHFSPYCHHCKAIAPTWQTLYEFYHTSNPLLSSTSEKSTDSETSLNSFRGYYNFHFASMDCLAYADKCKELGIKAFPSFVLYRDGEVVHTFVGKKSMEGLSNFVEERLELIRPGSRPRTGIKVPEPGATKGAMTQMSEKPESPNESGEEVTPQGQTNDLSPSISESGNPSQEVKVGQNTKIPNPEGNSVPLTAESFLRRVTTTQEPWFVKFYAPWCVHCQALAPVWQQMARDMKGKLNIGEVNCEVERRLCKDARVSTYPTMHFFRGGERVEYEGLRGLGDLISYARKAADAVGAGIQYVDAPTFEEMEKTEEVIFLYFFDHATTSEDFAALDRVTLSLVGRARLVKTNSTVLAERFRISTWPRLLVSRDGRPSYYTALAPKDMRDFRQVFSWMRSVWLPIVPELTVSNAREVMEGKYVVLGILNRQHPEDFAQNKRELRNAALEWMEKQTKLFQLERQEMRDAKELRIEEADDRNDQRALRSAKSMRISIREDDKKQVGFAWVDGIFWDRWVRSTYGIDVKNGERVIINDEDNRHYWDSSPNGVDIMPSRTSILETLTHIISSSSKVKTKSTVGFFESLFFSARSFTFSHPFISLALFIIALTISSLWVKGQIRRVRATGKLYGSGSGSSGAGFFHLEGKEGGLFGGGGGGPGDGKVD